MVISYRKRTINSLQKSASFIESENTEGSGERWAEKIRLTIRALAESKAKFSLCKAPQLARWNYSCYSHNGWVMAFKTSRNKFEVCRIIWGANLNY